MVGLGRPDLAAVEALARLQLTALRMGGSILVQDMSTDLEELLDLVGLRDQLSGQAERREQAGVEEGMEPGNPVT